MPRPVRPWCPWVFGLLIVMGAGALSAEPVGEEIAWRRTTRGWEEVTGGVGDGWAPLPPITAVHPGVVMALQVLLCAGAFLLWPATQVKKISVGEDSCTEGRQESH